MRCSALIAAAGCSVALLLATPSVVAAATSVLPGTLYEIDVPHSHVGFSARYMGVVDIRGALPGVRGTLVYVPEAPERSTITVVIDAASLDTNHKLRDADLRGPDFFDVARHPTAAFTSRRITRRGESFLMVGELTIRNVTREVAIRFSQIHPPVVDALGVTRVGFGGTARISRLDFGIVGSRLWNSEFAPGRFAIGDSVDIELTVEAKFEGVEQAPPAPAGRRSVADSLFAIATSGGAPAVASALERLQARGGGAYDLSLGSLLALAGRLRQQEQSEGAVEVMKKAVELYPNTPDAHEALAVSHAMAGARSLALASAQRALTLNPQLTTARELLRCLR